MSESVSILVVEDHQITRKGLLLVLKKFAEFNVVGEAINGREAVSKCLELKPSVVLMDIGLPLMTGIQAAKEIKERAPETHVVMLTTEDQDDAIFSALAAGADGYCLKTISAAHLHLAIMSAVAGAAWLDPGIAKRVLQASRSANKTVPHSKFPLTPREKEVLHSIVDGLTNIQIGMRLQISPETVKTHIRGIMEKLSVSDRTQAAVIAIKQGLIGR